MLTAIFAFLTALLQAILEIFKAVKKTPEQESLSQLQKDQEELNKALASGDAMAISAAFEKLRQRTLVQVPDQVSILDKDKE